MSAGEDERASDGDGTEERVAEYLERLEREPELTPEAFADGEPDPAALVRAIRAAREVQALLGASAPDRPERIGPYRVLGRLGGGGMGVVYAVERDGRRFALKLLAPGLAAAPRALERFQREARSLERLTHPGIVRILASGVFQGAPYLVMEHVEGPTLAELDLPLPPERAASIVRDLALAVEAAHAEGVLHRDLKPSNVILRAGDAPVLLDFGLGSAEDENTLTSSGALLGTPRYMAPEQAAGAPAERRTDVHALGLILFELLHGEPARGEGSRDEVLARARRAEVRRASAANVPGELARLLGATLAREVHRRPASAARVAEELGRFLSGERVHCGPPRYHQRLLDGARRRRRALFFGALGIAAVSLVARGVLPPRFPAPTAEVRAERDAHVDAALCAWLQGSEAVARLEVERTIRLEPAFEPEERVGAALDAALRDGVPVPERPRWIADGLVALRTGDPCAAAAALAEPAHASDPSSAPAAALLVRALSHCGRSAEALREARAGHEHHPDSAALLGELARALEDSGDAESALMLLREAPAASAGQAPLLARRVGLALATGASDEAVEIALRAAELAREAGGDPAAELPRLLSLADAKAETRAALDRRQANGPPSALVAFARGYAEDSQHRLEEAAAAYERALELDPNLLRAHLNLAHLYAGAQLGACRGCDRAYAATPEMLAPERAVAHLRQALRIDHGEGEACVGHAVQTALNLDTRRPEAGARAKLRLELETMLGRSELSAGGRRRLEEGLARLRGADGD